MIGPITDRGTHRGAALPFLRRAILCATLAWAAAPAHAEPPLTETGKYILVPTNEYVVRMAMDLLGAHPTVEQLDGVLQGTLPIEDLLSQFLDDPRFHRRLEWIANDFFLTERINVPFFQEALGEMDEEEAAASLGKEPLKLFSYLVEHDLPMTDLVTADYTIADSTLASFWNIDYPGPPGGSEWLKARYRDGRPHAGVLSMQSFYYRYGSTASNKQRGRANAITRIFLDDDHFQRNVAFEFRLAANQEADLDRAVRYNLGCLACHASLEGVVAHLQAIQIGPVGDDIEDRDDFEHYSKQGVERWQLINERVPAYYGRPSDGNLKTLGGYIAQDPRFALTLTKRVTGSLTQTTLDHRDRDLLLALNDVFVQSGFRLKDLVRAIARSDYYRAAGATPPASPEEARNLQPFRMATPEQMASLCMDLTGQTWGNRERPSLEYDPEFKIPAGGYDGEVITKRSFAITPIYLLTYQRNAEALANAVYNAELTGNEPPVEERKVFTLISGREDPVANAAAVRAQIAHWFKRFYGESVSPDGPEATQIYNLLLDFRADRGNNTRQGWRDVLALLLRDPKLYFY
ncbi:MAG: hypothetical protein GHCLOJNM_03193 [bacterium]|nr:hypothetical protein [bacterium]